MIARGEVWNGVLHMDEKYCSGEELTNLNKALGQFGTVRVTLVGLVLFKVVLNIVQVTLYLFFFFL